MYLSVDLRRCIIILCWTSGFHIEGSELTKLDALEDIILFVRDIGIPTVGRVHTTVLIHNALLITKAITTFVVIHHGTVSVVPTRSTGVFAWAGFVGFFQVPVGNSDGSN
ncbi:unnamed protein product [Allacma fusca]|uniref:Uncharacterized protein n=1 Tax=Allacma fusca TaxID=39272 RepID=A0A8J2P7D7_9HEXA|nr:unnamed protein product [Allacma fusca]